jgi:hypothetical protein
MDYERLYDDYLKHTKGVSEISAEQEALLPRLLLQETSVTGNDLDPGSVSTAPEMLLRLEFLKQQEISNKEKLELVKKRMENAENENPRILIPFRVALDRDHGLITSGELRASKRVAYIDAVSSTASVSLLAKKSLPSTSGAVSNGPVSAYATKINNLRDPRIK